MQVSIILSPDDGEGVWPEKVFLSHDDARNYVISNHFGANGFFKGMSKAELNRYADAEIYVEEVE